MLQPGLGRIQTSLRSWTASCGHPKLATKSSPSPSIACRGTLPRYAPSLVRLLDLPLTEGCVRQVLELLGVNNPPVGMSCVVVNIGFDDAAIEECGPEPPVHAIRLLTWVGAHRREF